MARCWTIHCKSLGVGEFTVIAGCWRIHCKSLGVGGVPVNRWVFVESL